LDRFVERVNARTVPGDPPIELPFPIATEADAGKARNVDCELRVMFRAREIAIPKNPD